VKIFLTLWASDCFTSLWLQFRWVFAGKGRNPVSAAQKVMIRETLIRRRMIISEVIARPANASPGSQPINELNDDAEIQVISHEDVIEINPAILTATDCTSAPIRRR
jgi:hypothetical protein